MGCGSGSVGKPLPGTGQSLEFLLGVASTNNESCTQGRMLGLLTLVAETQQSDNTKAKEDSETSLKRKGNAPGSVRASNRGRVRNRQETRSPRSEY